MSPARYRQLATTLAVCAAAAVIAAIALIIFGTGSKYTLHAQFEDSGQLVTGGEVQIAGRQVGSIAKITVTPGGLADVKLSLTSGYPLHAGTHAQIRALGQAGVANRYVQLLPGPASRPALRSGAVLGTADTSGIVDLDAVLDTFDPSTRAAVQQLLAHSSDVFAGSGSAYFNRLLARLDPASATLGRLTGQIADDRVALSQLVSTGALAARTAASRAGDLENGVTYTARTLQGIAAARTNLSDLLGRAPAFLAQASHTLAGVSHTVHVVRPTLRAVAPVGRPLKGVLDVLPGTLRQATPPVRDLTHALPALRRTLNGLKPLTRRALPALSATRTALTGANPILAGLREYGADFFLGLFNGLAGISSGTYNSTGHYVHVEFVQPYQTVLEGPLSTVLTAPDLENNLFAERTKLLARCPGGNEPPAPDGSSPWVISGICDPADDVPLSVDSP